MDRKLIYADELKEKLSGVQFAGMGYYKANKAVDECSAVDAVPVVHGHWIEHLHYNYDGEYSGSDYECSCCGFNDVYDIEDYNYCPLCGAKMDGERRCDNGTK
jgi:rubrerythrin